MKKLSLALILTLAMGLFAGCQAQKAENADTTVDTSLEDIKAKGTFVIGLDDTFVPMGFRNESGELVGFDIDFAKAVGEKMGIEIVFQPIDWDAKEMELKTKKVDALWNGLSITEKRKEVMQFTDPYLDNKLVIMTKAENNIHTKADLAGKNVGTQAQSAALDALVADDCASSIKEISEYKDYDTAIMDLEIGRIDAIIVDEVLGSYKNSQKGNIFVFAEEDFGPDEYGVALRLEDKTLFEEFNKAFEEAIADGTASQISEKWFGKDIVLK